MNNYECPLYNGESLLTAFGIKYQLEYEPKPNDNYSIVNNNALTSDLGGSLIGLGTVDWKTASLWYQAWDAGKDVRVSLASEDAFEMTYQPVEDSIGGGRMNDASLLG